MRVYFICDISKVCIFLFSFYLCHCVQAQNTEIDSNGYNKIYYPNGKLLSEGHLKKGRPEGYWKTYYTNGNLKSEGNRKNHLLDSTWIFYNLKGDTIEKINYLLGKKNGYHIRFYINPDNPINTGNFKSKELYVQNKKEGRSYYYYENGDIHKIINYSNNKKEGIAKEFASNGRLITLMNYRDDKIYNIERINRFNEKGLKHGIWKFFNDDDRVIRIESYKNGLKNGYFKEYDLSGEIKTIVLYEEGRIVKEEEDEESAEAKYIEERSDNGRLLKSGNYKEKVPIGIHKKYNEQGEVTETKFYDQKGNLVGEGIVDNKGYIVGTWKKYNEKGDLIMLGKYENGRKNGMWKYFYDDGTIEQEGKYVNDKYQGEWKWYHKNGQLWRKENYLNGKEEGTVYEFDTLGNIIVKGKYIEGEKEGYWKTEINDYIAKGKYVNDRMDGKWKGYYEDGTIAYEGYYILGRPDGKHKYYHPNGKLRKEEIYNAGVRDGHWKKYNILGELTTVITYSEGRVIRINGEKFELNDVVK